MKTRARRISVNAMLLALLIIFTLLMNIPIFLIATAVLPIIVLTVACQVEGWFTSVIMSTAFGLLSFIGAFIIPSPLAPIFQNPLVSVLPRVLIGVLGLAVYKLCIYITNNIENRGNKINRKIATVVSSGIGGAFTVMCNTLFVLSSMWILFGGTTVAGTSISLEFITGLVSINFIIEILGTAIVTPPIVWALTKFIAQSNKVPLTDSEIAKLEGMSVDSEHVVCDDNDVIIKIESNDDINQYE